MNLEHTYQNNLKTMTKPEAIKATIGQANQKLRYMEEWDKMCLRKHVTAFIERHGNSDLVKGSVCDRSGYAVAC